MRKGSATNGFLSEVSSAVDISTTSIQTIVYSDGTDDYKVEVFGSPNNVRIVAGTEFEAFRLLNFNTEEPLNLDANGGADWKTYSSSADVKFDGVHLHNPAIQFPIGTSNVTYSSENFDVNNNLNISNGVFTPSEAGYYVIFAQFTGFRNSTDHANYIQLVKNGSSILEQHGDFGGRTITSGTSPSLITLNTIIHSNGSDNYRLRVVNGSSVAGDDITISGNFFAYRIRDANDLLLTKRNGGLSWEEGSLVKAKRTSNMNIPSGTWTTITHTTEDFDVNGEYNPSTGMFTPNQPGYYMISATADWDAGNLDASTRRIRLIEKTNTTAIVMKENSHRSVTGGNNHNRLSSQVNKIVYHDGTPNRSYYVQAHQGVGSTVAIGGTSTAPGCTFTVFKL